MARQVFGSPIRENTFRLDVEDTTIANLMVQPIRAASWNIAAINNNPFEYWMTNSDPAYNSLMQGVEDFIEHPGSDFPVSKIFTEEMFLELSYEMNEREIEGIQQLKENWKTEYSKRMIVSEFLKDKQIGLKRLISMPDRITNTINQRDGKVLYRPTVINAYEGCSLDSVQSWWNLWKHFMFHTPVDIHSGEDDALNLCRKEEVVCDLIGPILHTKYPAISVDEQVISVALQILHLAIFDAILIHMLNSILPDKWENLRSEICKSLIYQKSSRIRAILTRSYDDMDVVFIQEAAASFVKEVLAEPEMCCKYAVLTPWNLDGKRDQNSIILVDRQRFNAAAGKEVTQEVLDTLDHTFLAPGDLLVSSISDVHGWKWLLVSFHGDSNGRSTQPVMTAVDKIARTSYRDHILLVGVDANTHSTSQAPGLHSVHSFSMFLNEHDMVSSWGADPDASIWTTCSSRTYLQTQLNKAKPFIRRSSLSSKNLRDWILGYASQIVTISNASRDNTGCRTFHHDMVLPSKDFPSDHTIIHATLVMKKAGATSLAQLDPDHLLEPVEEEPAVRLFGASSDIHCPATVIRVEDASTLENLVTPNNYWAVGNIVESPGKVPTSRSTAFDSWGIREKPSAVSILLQRSGSFRQMQARVPDSELKTEVPIEVEIYRFCEQHFIEFASKPQDRMLDTRHLLSSKIQDRSIWIMFSSRPCSIFMCTFWGQIACSLIGVALLIEVIWYIIAAVEMSTVQGKYFRFTALELRNGSFPINAQHLVDSIGLLQLGCRLTARQNISRVTPEVVMSFDEPVAADGWYFLTGRSDIELDPVRFRFETSLDYQSWREIQPPPWTLKRDLAFVPTERLAAKYLDLRPPWQWISQSCVGQGLIGVGSLCAIILGRLGWGRRAVVVLLWCHLVLACINAVIGVQGLVAGSDNARQAAALNVVIAVAAAAIAATFYFERFALDCYPCLVLCLGLSFYYEKSLYITGWASFLLPLSTMMVLVVVCFGLVVARHHIRRWAFDHLVHAEKESYDALWRSLLNHSTAPESLLQLRASVGKVSRMLASKDVRQRQPAPINQPSSRRVSWFADERIRRLMPKDQGRIASLEQLYLQAACCNIFLKEKAKSVAFISNGCFLVAAHKGGHETRSFLKWKEMQVSSMSEQIIWADLKPPERALEKLLRSYDCDVSRLLDCCRQTIYFETLQDLLACLEAIRRDEELEIVRIKNRMDERFDARFSGGFRNVILNLRIQTEYTKRLAIDSHICELQLTLTSFAGLMSNENHDRYHILRSCREYVSILEVAFNFLRSLWSQASRIVLVLWPINSIHPSVGSADLEAPSSVDAVISLSRRLPPCSRSLTDGAASDQISALTSHAERRAMLEEQFATRVRSLPSSFGPGHSKAKVLEEAIAHVSVGSVWDTSHPFAAALCKRWMPAILLLTAAFVGFDLVTKFSVIYSGTAVRARLFRFVTLETRKGGLPAASGSTIAALGLTKDGCSDSFTTLNVQATASNGTYTLAFPSEVEMDAWWFQTSDGPPQADPVRFYLEVSDGNDTDASQWEMIASSDMEWTWAGTWSYDLGPFDTPLERNRRVNFEATVPLAWYMWKAWINIVLVLLCGGLLLARYQHNHMHGRWIVAGSYSIMCTIDGYMLSDFAKNGHGAIAMVTAVFVFVDVGFVLVFAFGEKYTKHFFMLAGVSYLASLVVYHVHLLGRPEGVLGSSGGLENDGFVVGVACIFISGSAYVTRIHSRLRADRIVSRDRAEYTKCWAAILNDPGAHAVLALMHTLTSSLAAHLHRSVRQRGRPWPPPDPAATQNRVPSSESVSQASPSQLYGPLVVDLDQLFTQAAGLDIFLREKVQHWAAQSGGSFPVVAAGGDSHHHSFMRWEEICREPALAARVKWARPKTRQRAVEKLFRVYDSDVSRLLDCCRQSIYFEDVAGMLSCLEVIAADREVQLVRVNNRLHEHYDAGRSAGYRDVQLNMRITTEETARLFLDTHVCEVQLVLVDFARIKTDAGHARYVTWRDQRGA